jgi:alanine-glyoxylate transaminase/serine-glyoxylate transaminase/serine-pyruvate transaminase
MQVRRGRQFLQHPGPTNIPDRILRAIAQPVIDYNSEELQAIFNECQDGLRRIFKTKHAVLTYTASGHGAWEAALVNLCSPGDRVLVIGSGFFSAKWAGFAQGLGLNVSVLDGDNRAGADPRALEAHLAADQAHEIVAVLLVHNETSTGVANQCADMRRAIDRAGHPALFLIDAISSLACFDVRMDEWGADVVVGGCQKGLMLPVGLSFTGVSDKAIRSSRNARMPRAYWDWRRLMTGMRQTSFHGTQPVNLIFGLQEAIHMLDEEGLDKVFARHHRVAEATRRAVAVWQENGGPQSYAVNPKSQSDTVTTVLMPVGYDADELRQICVEQFNVALAPGLGDLKGRVFRIGHIGDLSEAMILGTIASVETAMAIASIPHGSGGINAAIEYLAGASELSSHNDARIAAIYPIAASGAVAARDGSR